MNRPIEFRGKSKSTGQWVYSSAIHYQGGSLFLATDLHVRETEGRRPHMKWEEVIGLGQFTGLTDSEGTKIFEGDILDAGSWGITHVIFLNGSFVGWSMNELYPSGPNMKIGNKMFKRSKLIGNIHDNPELIQ